MISLRFRPEFSDEWTEVSFFGPDEESGASVLSARLLNADFEVETLGDDGYIDILEAE